MDPKNVFKAPWAPIYNNFEWGARAEKKLFFVKIFQKVPKNAFLGLFFFRKNACGADYLGTKQCVRRARKIILVDLKKVDKFFELFFKLRSPPLQKMLDSPLIDIITIFMICIAV